MAGDWIKMRVDLSDDPAVIGLACALNVDEYGIVGRLHKLWSWADKHCDNGHAKSVTFVWINRYVCLDMFAENMASVGWLIKNEDGITFPRFDKHNGKSAKTRAEAQERKRKERNNIDVTEDSGQMSQLLCDTSVTREEKRREEKNVNTLTNPNGLVVASDAADESANQDAITKTGTNCPHQEIIALYHEVLPQCPKVRNWTLARATQLRARWNEDSTRQNMTYWRRFFEYVKTCDFLVGVQPDSRKTPFFADLEWMVKQANFTKIRERKYEPR
jgi:hypothetical protein